MIHRTDNNQADIINFLRKCGINFSIAITSQLGYGFPDVVIGYRNFNFMFEIKNPQQYPSQKRLTPEEKKFIESWQGQVTVVETVHEILMFIYNTLVRVDGLNDRTLRSLINQI